MRRCSFESKVMLCVVGLVCLGAIAMAEDDPVPSAVKKALLTENWETTAQQCGDQEALAKSAVRRIIKGHALLALNRNNESFDLFSSASGKEDLNRWRNWALSFAEQNAMSPVALYLMGDALARVGKWNEAVASYTKALELRKGFALALNARGVAYTYIGELDKARDDFKAACAAAPDFADAYASLGTCEIVREGAIGAVASYKRAISLSKSKVFALAKNGMGCATIGYGRDPKSIAEALAAFDAAEQCPSVKPLAESNVQKTFRIVEGPTAEQDSLSAGGTTLTTRDMLHMDSQIRGDYLNRMSNADLLRAYDQTHRNAIHSERWGGIWDSINFQAKGFGIDLSKKSDSSFLDGRGWRGTEAQIYQQLKNRGIEPPGGADTKGAALDKSYGDIGDWPVTNTRFGLIPHFDLPEPGPFAQ